MKRLLILLKPALKLLSALLIISAIMVPIIYGGSGATALQGGVGAVLSVALGAWLARHRGTKLFLGVAVGLTGGFSVYYVLGGLGENMEPGSRAVFVLAGLITLSV